MSGASAFDYEARLIAMQRSGHACEVRVLPECRKREGAGVMLSLQHRRARGMGGSHDARLGQPSNALVVCGDGVRGCHGWIEEHPVAATVNGWRLGPRDVEPGDVAVTLWDGRQVWLGNGPWYE